MLKWTCGFRGSHPSTETRSQLAATKRWCVPLAIVMAVVGCSQTEHAETAKRAPRPRGELKVAMRKQNWQEAWSYSDAVLAKHADDADAIADVAQVAQNLGKTDELADLLVQACEVEAFENDDRVRQAMIALVGIGRLYDAIELLEQAVQAEPSRHSTRRLLYDLYLNAGNESAATPHGRQLVLDRQFDAKLLVSVGMGTIESDDPGATLEMVQRNPNDKRPLLRQAKQQFDDEHFALAITTLEEITAQRKGFLPAQTLLGLVLAMDGQTEAFERWEEAFDSEDRTTQAEYWLAKAEIASARGDEREARRAYWHSTHLDPDRIAAWSGILRLAKDMDTDRPELSEVIQQRIDRLQQSRSSMSRFVRTGAISRRLAIEIANSLADLGRLWEAEAWASMATTLPEDDSVDVETVRKRIVDRLRDRPPWQQVEGHPELDPKLLSSE
ncbi:tetratricopeptide repeat protein [Rhodopirellula sp. JC737]|nr:tetratricopeptide repeat protein [Rhodopirellula sp. JC737]